MTRYPLYLFVVATWVLFSMAVIGGPAIVFAQEANQIHESAEIHVDEWVGIDDTPEVEALFIDPDLDVSIDELPPGVAEINANEIIGLTDTPNVEALLIDPDLDVSAGEVPPGVVRITVDEAIGVADSSASGADDPSKEALAEAIINLDAEPDTATLLLGGSVQVTVTATLVDGSTMDLTGDPRLIFDAVSLDPRDILGINAPNVIVGKQVGTAQVSVTLPATTPFTDSVQVTVANLSISKLDAKRSVFSERATIGLVVGVTDKGVFVQPDLDDEAEVGFERGSSQVPAVLGGLYNGVDVPPDTDIKDADDNDLTIGELLGSRVAIVLKERKPDGAYEASSVNVLRKIPVRKHKRVIQLPAKEGDKGTTVVDQTGNLIQVPVGGNGQVDTEIIPLDLSGGLPNEPELVVVVIERAGVEQVTASVKLADVTARLKAYKDKLDETAGDELRAFFDDLGTKLQTAIDLVSKETEEQAPESVKAELVDVIEASKAHRGDGISNDGKVQATVIGTVYYSDGTTPVEDAVVWVTLLSAGEVATFTTGQDGQYEVQFSGVGAFNSEAKTVLPPTPGLEGATSGVITNVNETVTADILLEELEETRVVFFWGECVFAEIRSAPDSELGNHGSDAVEKCSTMTNPKPLDNLLPRAAAGGPYSAIEGEDVTLNGSGSSDEDGTIEKHEWLLSPGSGVHLPRDVVFLQGSIITFSPPLINSTWRVDLTVTDDDGSWSSETSLITINPPRSELTWVDCIRYGLRPVPIAVIGTEHLAATLGFCGPTGTKTPVSAAAKAEVDAMDETLPTVWLDCIKKALNGLSSNDLTADNVSVRTAFCGSPASTASKDGTAADDPRQKQRDCIIKVAGKDPLLEDLTDADAEKAEEAGCFSGSIDDGTTNGESNDLCATKEGKTPEEIEKLRAQCQGIEDKSSTTKALEIASPKIVTFVADDPIDDNVIYGSGDTLTIGFNEPTNQGGFANGVLNRTQIDSLFVFAPSFLGVNDSGSWLSNQRFQIVVASPLPIIPPTILATTVKPSGITPILNSPGTSGPADGAAVLSGDFGMLPNSGLGKTSK